MCVSIQIKPVFPHSHTYPHLSAHGYVLIRFLKATLDQISLDENACILTDAKISEPTFYCCNFFVGEKKNILKLPDLNCRASIFLGIFIVWLGSWLVGRHKFIFVKESIRFVE